MRPACPACAEAVDQFRRYLRPRGRISLQVLNFPPMREELPCVHGPRVSTVGGREHVSVRQFHFGGDTVRVTGISVWNDQQAGASEGGWKRRAHCGRLYTMTLDELEDWCAEGGLTIESACHSYAGEPLDRCPTDMGHPANHRGPVPALTRRCAKIAS